MTKERTVPKITPFLWFDNNAYEAAQFYLALFPNSFITEHQQKPDGTTFTLTMVLDDIIYKESSERTGDGNVQPIFCFIKGGVSEPPAPAAPAEPPASAARAGVSQPLSD
jgi:hypothetical protein